MGRVPGREGERQRDRETKRRKDIEGRGESTKERPGQRIIERWTE